MPPYTIWNVAYMCRKLNNGRLSLRYAALSRESRPRLASARPAQRWVISISSSLSTNGEMVKQKMGGREELAGRDVILVHRLLKNAVSEKVGRRA